MSHDFPHQDSLPALIRPLGDWRPKFSACQLIWSHRYGSNLIWGERAGFCQCVWDKAASFTNPLNKLNRKGPVTLQWSPPHRSLLPPCAHSHFNESPYLTFTSTCHERWWDVEGQRREKEETETVLLTWTCGTIKKEQGIGAVFLPLYAVLSGESHRLVFHICDVAMTLLSCATQCSKH